LRLFVRETRRAELAHWWAMCCGLLFVLWNPPLAAALLIAYGVVANLPFIVIQRYNRFRIHALLERRS
jgi:glycosyl-4,4'-diaponeurosporenoate acyltransferase